MQSIEIKTSQKKIFTLKKQCNELKGIDEPIDVFKKEVKADIPSGNKFDRGEIEYVKVLKQAIIEVINENELVK